MERVWQAEKQGAGCSGGVGNGEVTLRAQAEGLRKDYRGEEAGVSDKENGQAPSLPLL